MVTVKATGVTVPKNKNILVCKPVQQEEVSVGCEQQKNNFAWD
ncbi:MAG: hypothetical protein QXS29_09845 [Nitrososphaeria archaeon]